MSIFYSAVGGIFLSSALSNINVLNLLVLCTLTWDEVSSHSLEKIYFIIHGASHPSRCHVKIIWAAKHYLLDTGYIQSCIGVWENLSNYQYKNLEFSFRWCLSIEKVSSLVSLLKTSRKYNIWNYSHYLEMSWNIIQHILLCCLRIMTERTGTSSVRI